MKRRSNVWKLQTPALSLCPECGEYKAPHKVCPNCGMYNGRQVIAKDELKGRCILCPYKSNP